MFQEEIPWRKHGIDDLLPRYRPARLDTANAWPFAARYRRLDPGRNGPARRCIGTFLKKCLSMPPDVCLKPRSLPGRPGTTTAARSSLNAMRPRGPTYKSSGRGCNARTGRFQVRSPAPFWPVSRVAPEGALDCTSGHIWVWTEGGMAHSFRVPSIRAGIGGALTGFPGKVCFRSEADIDVTS